MTNYEKIKCMSKDEMRDFLYDNAMCTVCVHHENGKKCASCFECADGMQKWLESEADET